jgi:urocanate hydratase
MGGMGGAQPLAATMNGAAFLGIEVDPARIRKRLETGYCQRMTGSLDEAMRWVEDARIKKERLSVGLVGNSSDLLPEILRRNWIPDVLTDQTSAHDPLNGYVPGGMSLSDALTLRRSDPEEYQKRSLASIARHVEAMLAMQKQGAVTFDYGNNIRGQAFKAGVRDAFDFPGFVPAYIRPLFCQGRGPFRWVALSGDPRDIYQTDEAVKRLFPENGSLRRWIDLARSQVRFQGLPARIRGKRPFCAGDQSFDQGGHNYGARRHWARPPGLWLGRFTLPGNGSDAGWQRRDRRLADLERPAKCDFRRQLGFGSQWRRRRHWLFTARRAGLRC